MKHGHHQHIKRTRSNSGIWLWPLMISMFLVAINFIGYFVIVSADIEVSRKLIAILILCGLVVLMAAFFCVAFYMSKAINDIGAISIIVIAIALVLVDLTLRFSLEQHFLNQ